jgi:hypothetical protein
MRLIPVKMRRGDICTYLKIERTQDYQSSGVVPGHGQFKHHLQSGCTAASSKLGLSSSVFFFKTRGFLLPLDPQCRTQRSRTHSTASDWPAIKLVIAPTHGVLVCRPDGDDGDGVGPVLVQFVIGPAAGLKNAAEFLKLDRFGKERIKNVVNFEIRKNIWKNM